MPTWACARWRLNLGRLAGSCVVEIGIAQERLGRIRSSLEEVLARARKLQIPPAGIPEEAMGSQVAAGCYSRVVRPTMLKEKCMSLPGYLSQQE